MAFACRGSHLDHPALGRQRHDRALGRYPACVHDAGRCRACARGRTSRARAVCPGKSLATDRAAHPGCRVMRCSAPPTWRGPTWPRPSTKASLRTPSWPSRALALLAARQGAGASRTARTPGPGPRRGNRSRPLRGAPSCMRRWHASPSTKDGRPMPARHCCASTARPLLDYGAPGTPSRSALSSPAPTSHWARPPPPARS